MKNSDNFFSRHQIKMKILFLSDKIHVLCQRDVSFCSVSNITLFRNISSTLFLINSLDKALDLFMEV